MEVEEEDDDATVPLFGTWPRIYAAVIAFAVLNIAFAWAFSLWPF